MAKNDVAPFRFPSFACPEHSEGSRGVRGGRAPFPFLSSSMLVPDILNRGSSQGRNPVSFLLSFVAAPSLVKARDMPHGAVFFLCLVLSSSTLLIEDPASFPRLCPLSVIPDLIGDPGSLSFCLSSCCHPRRLSPTFLIGDPVSLWIQGFSLVFRSRAIPGQSQGHASWRFPASSIRCCRYKWKRMVFGRKRN